MRSKIDTEFHRDYDGHLHIGAPSRYGQLTFSRGQTFDYDLNKTVHLVYVEVARQDASLPIERVGITFPVEETEKLIEWLKEGV